MTDPKDALKKLIAALENYYAPADSIYEVYANSPEVKAALDEAYEILRS